MPKKQDDNKTRLAVITLLMRVEKMLEHEGASTTIIDQRRQVVNVLSRLEDELRALTHGSAMALPAETEIVAG